ncbi:MAG: DUF177 domain-containing protein [Mesorhizobium sp.]|nr:DUF177 domain-containing protein [Mesorhizobium sp.]
MDHKPESPIAFPVSVRRLPQRGFPVLIEANERQRAQLAEAHMLLSVERFRADLLIRAWNRDGVQVTGTVTASIVQACIVTLEPIPAEIAESIDAVFVPESSPLAKPDIAEGELFLSADGPDGPETFDGETIDAGALAEEFFALAIDPYPRKQGAAVAAPIETDPEASPFAKLRDRLQKG